MGRDRRRSRYRAECPAQILVKDLPPAAALVIDLSYGGSFLETDSALPLGLRVKVRFMPPGKNPFLVGGHVLRVGHSARLKKQCYMNIRVPKSVMERVYEEQKRGAR